MDGSQVIVSRVTKPDRVRVAGESDRARLWELLMLAAAENAVFPINEHKVKEALDKIVQRERAVAGVIDGTTALAGMACLSYGQMWYTSAWHVEDMAVYVHPDYRRGTQNKGHARALLQFSKWWADQLGMPLLAGVLTAKRTRGKLRLYEQEMGEMKGEIGRAHV